MQKTRLERQMQSFTYGSRVINNEPTQRLNRHVQRLGNALGAFVKLLLAILLFSVVNFTIAKISQQTNLLTPGTLRFIYENFPMLVHNGTLYVLRYMYQYAFCIALAIAVSCIRQIALMIEALVYHTGTSVDTNRASIRNNFAQSEVAANRAISYRDKVCFLS